MISLTWINKRGTFFFYYFSLISCIR